MLSCRCCQAFARAGLLVLWTPSPSSLPPGIAFIPFFFFFLAHTRSIWRFPGQARGLIGPVVAGLHQCQILNPLSEARDRTRNLMVPSQIR